MKRASRGELVIQTAKQAQRAARIQQLLRDHGSVLTEEARALLVMRYSGSGGRILTLDEMSSRTGKSKDAYSAFESRAVKEMERASRGELVTQSPECAERVAKIKQLLRDYGSVLSEERRQLLEMRYLSSEGEVLSLDEMAERTGKTKRVLSSLERWAVKKMERASRGEAVTQSQRPTAKEAQRVARIQQLLRDHGSVLSEERRQLLEMRYLSSEGEALSLDEMASRTGKTKRVLSGLEWWAVKKLERASRGEAVTQIDKGAQRRANIQELLSKFGSVLFEEERQLLNLRYCGPEERVLSLNEMEGKTGVPWLALKNREKLAVKKLERASRGEPVTQSQRQAAKKTQRAERIRELLAKYGSVLSEKARALLVMRYSGPEGRILTLDEMASRTGKTKRVLSSLEWWVVKKMERASRGEAVTQSQRQAAKEAQRAARIQQLLLDDDSVLSRRERKFLLMRYLGPEGRILTPDEMAERTGRSKSSYLAYEWYAVQKMERASRDADQGRAENPQHLGGAAVLGVGTGQSVVGEVIGHQVIGESGTGILGDQGIGASFTTPLSLGSGSSDSLVPGYQITGSPEGFSTSCSVLPSLFIVAALYLIACFFKQPILKFFVSFSPPRFKEPVRKFFNALLLVDLHAVVSALRFGRMKPKEVAEAADEDKHSSDRKEIVPPVQERDVEGCQAVLMPERYNVQVEFVLFPHRASDFFYYLDREGNTCRPFAPGTAVRAIADGRVAQVLEYKDGYWNHIFVAHDHLVGAKGVLCSVYCHIKLAEGIRVGARVSQNQILGQMTVGRWADIFPRLRRWEYPAHLHFECLFCGQTDLDILSQKNLSDWRHWLSWISKTINEDRYINPEEMFSLPCRLRGRYWTEYQYRETARVGQGHSGITFGGAAVVGLGALGWQEVIIVLAGIAVFWLFMKGISAVMRRDVFFQENFYHKKSAQKFFDLSRVKILELARKLRNSKEKIKIAVVVPMYKEHNRIEPRSAAYPHGENFLRRKIWQIGELLHPYSDVIDWEMILVDDGCPNNSGRLAELILQMDYESMYNSKQIRVLYIRPDEKKTMQSVKGGAVIHGMRFAISANEWHPQPADIIIYTDADLSADLRLMGLLIDEVAKDKNVAAIGSRSPPLGAIIGNRPLQARLSSRFYNHLVRYLLPPLKHIRDTQCGFKAFSRKILEDILPISRDKQFSFDTKLLMLIRWKGYSIKEIGIPWYDSRHETTLNLKGSIQAARNLLRQRKYLRGLTEMPMRAEKSGQDDRAAYLLPGHYDNTLYVLDPARRSMIPLRYVPGDQLTGKERRNAIRSLVRWGFVAMKDLRRRGAGALNPELFVSEAGEMFLAGGILPLVRLAINADGVVEACLRIRRDKCMIVDVEVRKESRRRGIGSEILIAAVQELLEHEKATASPKGISLIRVQPKMLSALKNIMPISMRKNEPREDQNILFIDAQARKLVENQRQRVWERVRDSGANNREGFFEGGLHSKSAADRAASSLGHSGESSSPLCLRGTYKAGREYYGKRLFGLFRFLPKCIRNRIIEIFFAPGYEKDLILEEGALEEHDPEWEDCLMDFSVDIEGLGRRWKRREIRRRGIARIRACYEKALARGKTQKEAVRLSIRVHRRHNLFHWLAPLTIQDDQDCIDAMSSKLKSDYSYDDFDEVNAVASRIALEIFSRADFETIRKENFSVNNGTGIAPYFDFERFISEKGALYLYATELKSLFAALIKKGGPDVEVFCRCLIIGYHSLNSEAHRKSDRQERIQEYTRCLVFLETALLFRPEDQPLLSQLAIQLNHLKRRDEAEQVLMRREDRNQKSRKDNVTLGYVKIEMARQMFRDYDSALAMGRYAEAMILLEEVLSKASEGRVVLQAVISSYRQEGRMDMLQIPRAFSGLATLEIFISDMYMLASKEGQLLKIKDYELLTLSHAVTAFDYSVRAVMRDESNEHSIKIYDDVVSHLERILKVFCGRSLLNRKLVRELSKIMNKLQQGLAKNGYRVPEKCKEGIRGIVRARIDILTRVDSYQRVEEVIALGIKTLLLRNPYVELEVFEADLKGFVTEHLPEGSRESAGENVDLMIRGLDLNLADLLIIQNYFLLADGERDVGHIASGVLFDLKNSPSSSVAGISEAEITRFIVSRFKTGRYEILGLSLKDEEKGAADKEEELQEREEHLIQPDMNGYNKGDVSYFTDADEKRIAQAESLYEKVSPWLSEDRVDRLGNLIQEIRRGIASFGEKGRGLLDKSTKEIGGELQILKIIRVGQDGRKGYMARMRKLEFNLQHAVDAIEKQIRADRSIVQDALNHIRSKEKEFGFRWLGRIAQAVARDVEIINAVMDTKSVDYLSRVRLDEAVASVESEVRAAEFVDGYRDDLGVIGGMIKEIEETLDILKKKLEGKNDAIRLWEMFEEIKEAYADTAFSVDFEKQVGKIKERFSIFLDYVGMIADCIERKERLKKQYDHLQEILECSQGAYLNPSREQKDKEAAARESLDAIRLKLDDLGLSLPHLKDMDEYRREFYWEEQKIVKALGKARPLVCELQDGKQLLILREVKKIRLLLETAFDWIGETLISGYLGHQKDIGRFIKHAQRAEDFWAAFEDLLASRDFPETPEDRSSDRFKRILKDGVFIDNLAVDFEKLREGESAAIERRWRKMREGEPDEDLGKEVSNKLRADRDFYEMHDLSFRKWPAFYGCEDFPTIVFLMMFPPAVNFYFQMALGNIRMPVVDAYIVLRQFFFKAYKYCLMKPHPQKEVIDARLVDEWRPWVRRWRSIRILYGKLAGALKAERTPKWVRGKVDCLFDLLMKDKPVPPLREFCVCLDEEEKTRFPRGGESSSPLTTERDVTELIRKGYYFWLAALKETTDKERQSWFDQADELLLSLTPKEAERMRQLDLVSLGFNDGYKERVKQFLHRFDHLLIGRRLKELRGEKSLSRVERETGVARNSILRAEQGKAGLPTYLTLANYYKVDLFSWRVNGDFLPLSQAYDTSRIKEILSANIRRILKKKNFMQKDLAAASKIPVATIRPIVKGSDLPRLKPLIFIAAALAIPAAELLRKNIENDKDFSMEASPVEDLGTIDPGDIDWPALGRRVEKIRLQQGLSLAAIDREGEIASRALLEIEKGRARDIHFRTLVIIANRFKTHITTLLTGKRCSDAFSPYDLERVKEVLPKNVNYFILVKAIQPKDVHAGDKAAKATLERVRFGARIPALKNLAGLSFALGAPIEILIGSEEGFRKYTEKKNTAVNPGQGKSPEFTGRLFRAAVFPQGEGYRVYEDFKTVETLVSIKNGFFSFKYLKGGRLTSAAEIKFKAKLRDIAGHYPHAPPVIIRITAQTSLVEIDGVGPGRLMAEYIRQKGSDFPVIQLYPVFFEPALRLASLFQITQFVHSRAKAQKFILTVLLDEFGHHVNGWDQEEGDEHILKFLNDEPSGRSLAGSVLALDPGRHNGIYPIGDFWQRLKSLPNYVEEAARWEVPPAEPGFGPGDINLEKHPVPYPKVSAEKKKRDTWLMILAVIERSRRIISREIIVDGSTLNTAIEALTEDGVGKKFSGDEFVAEAERIFGSWEDFVRIYISRKKEKSDRILERQKAWRPYLERLTGETLRAFLGNGAAAVGNNGAKGKGQSAPGQQVPGFIKALARAVEDFPAGERACAERVVQIVLSTGETVSFQKIADDLQLRPAEIKRILCSLRKSPAF
ncbi:MAG: peptidoglycan DD-metalloendopeptidase family protein, partial [Candidatus Omnitrophota bacterium]